MRVVNKTLYTRKGTSYFARSQYLKVGDYCGLSVLTKGLS